MFSALGAMDRLYDPETVSVEISDDQLAPADPRHFAQNRFRLRKVMEGVRRDDGIEIPIGEWQVGGIGQHESHTRLRRLEPQVQPRLPLGLGIFIHREKGTRCGIVSPFPETFVRELGG